MLEITGQEISELNDSDLRSLVGLLCEAELRANSIPTAGVTWGGHHTAKDGGLDVRIQISASPPQDGYIPRSNTGFQVKKPKMPPSEIKEEMCPNGELREVIRELANNSGAYIIVSGTDSTTDSALADRRKAMRAALSNIDNASSLKTDFFDRERIAAWVRCNTSLVLWIREKIGKPIQGWQSFGNWANAPGGLEEEYYLDSEIRIHDGTKAKSEGMTALDGIITLRKALQQPRSSVRLAGLSGIGKTRLVQALFDERIGETPLNQSSAYYTDLSHSPNPAPRNFAERLFALKTPAILVVDNCPPDLHRDLTSICTAPESSMSLLTVEYDVREDLPDETQVFRLEPSSIGLIETILQHRFNHLSQVDSRTIANFSGGNARIAIALAKTIRGGETLGGLKDEELFQRLFRQRNETNSALLKSAEVCSLVYSFDCQTEGNSDTELRLLASLADKTLTELYSDISELKSRELVQQRGIWQAVLPHAIANRLAQKALEKIPVENILHVFEKIGSERILRSFSKRLSYLHQSEGATKIAHRWLTKNGLLENIRNLDDLGIALLSNIAPLVPEAVLTKIEDASNGEEGKNFASRSNHRFSEFTRLLRSLAYDPKLFVRSADLLCRFALTEDPQENHNSIKECLKSLFYIYLSGTHATPEQRLCVIEKLVKSQSENRQDLGLALLSSALEAWHFCGYPSTFEFGAHSRDYGYAPRTRNEIIHWYRLFVQLAINLCISKESISQKAKQLFAESFRGLWTKAMLFDELEAASKTIISNGPWNEGWIAVRSTIKFDCDSMESGILERLQHLEKVLAPLNLLERARTYALAKPHRAMDLVDMEDDTPTASSLDKVETATKEIGREVAQDEEVFNELLPEILGTDSHQLHSFGQGLGEGCLDFKKTWQRLINQLNAISEEKRNYQVLRGFLNAASKIDKQISEDILNHAVTDEILGRVFPLLQTSVEIGESGAERLKKSLEFNNVPIWIFKYLGQGGAHESLSDTDLTCLLSKIRSKPDGLIVAIDILAMRLHWYTSKGHKPSNKITMVGQDCLKQVSFDYDLPTRDQMFASNLNRIANECLVGEAAVDATKVFCKQLAQALASHHFYPGDFHRLLETLAIKQPVAFLEGFLGDSSIESYRLKAIFSNEEKHRSNPLSRISDDIIIHWCEANPIIRYPIVASCITLFRKGTNGKTVEWAPISLILINKAPDPIKVLNNFFYPLYSLLRSGSYTDDLSKLHNLFSPLKKHQNATVAEWARENETKLEEALNSANQRDADLDRTQDERFE